MPNPQPTSHFQAKLERPAKTDGDGSWLFVLLPRDVSETLPRRGRTTAVGTINDTPFQETLEPDGQLSHWLRVGKTLQQKAELAGGDLVTIKLSAIEKEPEPELPPDFEEALARVPEARETWESTTTLARVDWIHWMVSAKQAKTREKRIHDACDMLAKGKKRVCCFDPSGYYSKAFSAPAPVESSDG